MSYTVDRRPPQPRTTSRGALRRDLDRIRAHAAELEDKAKRLMADIDEAHDAGLRSLRSGGRSIPPKGSSSDTTGGSATSYEFHRLQSVLRFVSGRTAKAEKQASAAVNALEDSIEAILGAWLDTDPKVGPERRAERKANREAAEEAARQSSAASWRAETELAIGE